MLWLIEILIVIILFGGFILFFQRKTTNKINKIIENNPKKRFQYLDTFFYNIVLKNSDNSSTMPIFLFVLIEEWTNQVYVINQALFRNAWYVSLFEKEWQLNRVKVGKNSCPVQFYDKGNFWIEQRLENYYKNDGNIITIDNKQFVYSRYLNDVNTSGNNNMQGTSILYNLNPKYDITLLNNAIFITGVVEFDSIDNMPL